jgi:peptidoglycan/xylan/chitin deacetylase (PgdA/CDA1 family)
MNRLLSAFFAFSFLSILGAMTLHQVYGDGLAAENRLDIGIGNLVIPSLVTNYEDTVRTIHPNCNCTAFKLDFIQDHYLNNVQAAIIKSFQTKDAALTIGLLGDKIGDNPKVVGLLKNRLNDNTPPIQLANRGWDNLDHTQYAEEQQSASNKKTSDKISRLFGVTPTIFIPPYNKFNNDTLDAMHENGIRYFSSNLSLDPGPYNLHNDVPFHIPETSQLSYLLDDDPFYKGTINEKAVAKIKLSLVKTGFSVVTIKSQDFAVKNGDSYQNQVDVQKLQSLESLIDLIKSNGLKIVTIDQIPQEVTSPKSPSWTNNIYTWYQQGTISYNEVINAVNYLIEKNIIKFDH